MGLNVTSLLGDARVAAGLNDFGDDWFIEPLKKLVDAINTEAGLASYTDGPVTRIGAALVHRLKLVELLKNNPAIRDEPVEVGAIILGLPRTGSTILHRLLSSARSTTAPMWWETAFPLPFENERPGDPTPRQEKAKQVVKELLENWPDFESIDPINAMDINEEVVLLEMGFLTTVYDSMMHIPSYGHWQAAQDQTRAYEELKLWLQVLQSQSPERRGRKWILKSPHHILGGLTGLLNVFPESKLIMTHRDVLQVLPSYCSMCASMTGRTSTTYKKEEQGAYWAQRFATGLKSFMDMREHLPSDKVLDVQFSDTVNKPVEVAKRCLAAMGLEVTSDDLKAFDDCLECNRREKRPSHKYVAGDFGLTEKQIKEDFAFYTDVWVKSQQE